MGVRIYTGVGSRGAPPDILQDMFDIGVALGISYGLRTGGAEGSDTAFADGAVSVGGLVCVYRPEPVRLS